MTSNKKTKIAVFGGSFDPLHFGHIDIMNNLERMFDKVIVMPSYISPFKSGSTDAAARYKLCKKLLSSNKTEVSRYEISKRNVSYSSDTASYLSRKYKDTALLSWVIGSEELTRLTEWHEIDKLKTLVTFFVVPRPGFTPDEQKLKEIKKRKIKIKFAGFTGADISSTRIKIDLAFGKPNSFLPSAVYEYALKNDAFDPYGKYVDALKRRGLDYNRMAHTYRTALRGEYLAKLYGANVFDTVTACILHDIAKTSDSVKTYSSVVDVEGYPEPTKHAPIGAYIAKKEFDVSDEIADAIRLHSTADENMSVIGEIVYLADKTEDGRKYPSLEHKRYLCELDKNIAMLAALKEIEALDGSDDCEMSKRAIKFYEKLCAGMPIPELPKPYATSNNLPHTFTHTRSVAAVPERSKEVRHVISHTKSPVPVDEDPEVRAALKKATGSHRIALTVADELLKHKGFDVAVIDVDGKTIVADYFVIASATSTTAVKALMGYAEDRLTKDFSLDPDKRDVNGEWIALDYGSVIIHIFTQKMREFYNIERLWSDGTNVEHFGD